MFAWGSCHKKKQTPSDQQELWWRVFISFCLFVFFSSISRVISTQNVSCFIYVPFLWLKTDQKENTCWFLVPPPFHFISFHCRLWAPSCWYNRIRFWRFWGTWFFFFYLFFLVISARSTLHILLNASESDNFLRQHLKQRVCFCQWNLN